MAQLTEVRWHGRGGQGAKTAGYILAVAAAEEGWNIQRALGVLLKVCVS